VASASSVSAARTRLRIFARPSTLLAFVPVALAAAGVLSALLMLIGLGSRPLWFDETVSVEAAKLSTTGLAHYVAETESNMSLYHVLLHLWLLPGGGDTFARGLSVVFGLATLPIVYALARRLFDTRTAVIAVVLLAGNVNFVGHAREARAYSLAVLLVAAAALFLVRAVQQGRRRDWALYAIAGVLAVYAHLLAALAILAQLVSLLVIRRRISTRLILFAAGGALLLAPLAIAVVTHSQGRQIDWVAAPRLRQLPGLLYWYTGSWTLTALNVVAGLIALTAAFADLRSSRSAPRVWPYALVVAWLAFPPLAAFAISFAKPVYLYRYFLVSLPALVVLVAAGLARIGRAWIVVPVVLAAVALSTRTTAACTPGCVIGQDDWRSAAAYVDSELRPGDGVLFDPGQLRTPFAHYLPPARLPRLLFPARWPLEGGRVDGASTPAAALIRARSARRVWLVTWWLPQGDIPAELARTRGTPAVRDFAGNVRVSLFGPARP
jgi:mannosyltransferase